MFPRGMIAVGVFLLLLAATGLIYALARKKPPLESPEPFQLQLQQETPVADEVMVLTPPVTKSREHVVVRRRQEPPPIKTFAVKILSPSMAQTFTAPANVTLTASASRERELTGIEYYKSPVEETVCQGLTNPAPFPANLKIGEAHTKPYEVVWNVPQASTFTVVAVATYEDGEKQISAPVVIVVDPVEPYDGPAWRGWEPAYPKDQQLQQDASLMPAPTPPESCPKIVVNRLPESPQSDTLSFQAVVTGAEVPPDLTFHWTVSAGEIVSGQDTSAINVAIDRILDPELVASVEIGRLPAVCSTFGSMSVRFEQPPWITKEFRSKLQQMRDKVAVDNNQIIRRYLQLYGERDDCVDQESLNEAKLLKRYFVEYRGLNDKDVVIANAGHSEEQEGLELRLVYADDTDLDELQKSLQRPLVPCRSSSSVASSNFATPINRACPDIDQAIEYSTSLRLGGIRINTCPYNPRDPLNTETQINLFSDVEGGVYSNYPSFKYWTNAGKLLSDRPDGIWDFSEIKLRPRRYTAIAMADDGCGCTNINTQPIAVTNFCSPCLTMRRTCSSAPEDEGLQFYHAAIAKFTVAEKTTLHWTTSKGKIIRGQGSPDVVIDTRGLPPGEQFVVTVAAGGLMRYCANTVSQPAVVEDFPCGRNVSKFDDFGAGRAEARRAHRRPQPEEEITESTTENEAQTGRPGEGPVYHGPPRTKEKEWMKLSWTPHVKTDDAVIIKVVYNRTTESFQVSNSSGEISEELKLGKPLKEYFGADYQTFGDIHLQAPGLKRDLSQEQFQSFDEEKLEWEWLLRPDGPGTYYFDVELWIKGEPRNQAADKPSLSLKKVWSETKNRIDVIPPFVTRQKVYAGVGMCAVLGLGLCVRGFKAHLHIGDTYNVGQAGVVGHNVTLTNTTVNQQATNTNLQNQEKHDG